ncbi:alpha-2-macroglobulin-like protein 1 isoform X2 [Aquarana catesbeiana]|uniref:alpha-2-macroglobulin-like protein 1 isoform X2 n=1 Tax=Aquarana catesbeiana TaxID=8400 RepID=UPI003CC92ECA
MWHPILLVCVVFSSTLGQHSFLNYLLLVPAQIEYPSTETVCLDITGARETLNVTVTLQHGTQDDTLLQQEMIPPKLFKCAQFKAPLPHGGKEEVISIHVSIVGPNTQLSESKNLLVSNMGAFTLIQTDKPVYKRGETVKIRILTFNSDLLAVNDTCPLVEIQDPNLNRIGQWLNIIPDKGMIDLSLPLDSESQLGIYTIIAPNAHQEFHVSEYEVPKFEVLAMLPAVITVSTKTLKFDICARYSFGKPVQGEIRAKLCRKSFCYYWMAMKNQCPQDICNEYQARTDRSGCSEMEVQTEAYNLNSYNYLMNFDAEASVIEDGTGIQCNATSSSKVSAMITKVTFAETEASNSYYKSGLRYKGKLKLAGADGSPMKSQTLYVTEKYDTVIKEHVYETDEKGEVCFSLDTKPWNGHSVYLTASYQKKKPERVFGILNPYSVDAHLTLNSFNSATNSFIKVQPSDHVLICGQKNTIEIDYLIRTSEMMTQDDTLDFHYVAVAMGNLVLNGEKKISINRSSVMIGTLEIHLPVNANLAPIAHILVYVLPGNGQIVADTEVFHINKCFDNKVTLAFSDKEVSPDSQTTLHVNAQPGSLCSVRSVDEGVMFLRPESDISSDAVYSLLAHRRRYGYPYRVREDNPVCFHSHTVYSYGAHKRKKRSYNLPYSAHSSAPDVFALIQHIGQKVLTNTQVRKPVVCPRYPPVSALSNFEVPQIEPHNSYVPNYLIVDEPDMPPIHPSISATEMNSRIRKRFPETLLWELVTVGISGHAEIKVHVPDSITEWKATAFCMGDKGLGIANATSLRAFQPFFVLITHPYSVAREEIFSVKASVFNYLPKPMMVKISLQNPPELKVNECSTCATPQCLYPEEPIVLTLKIQALKVGSAEFMISVEAIPTEEECEGEQPIVPDSRASDTVMKTVMIKAEGVPVEKSHNSILCGEANLSSETIFITAPPGAVPNSATAVFSVLGDLIGSALQGTDQLLSLPSGCGEQNMAKFALNIYVKDYLESTNQMTEDIKKLADDYMKHGYKRQLDFLREDFSFSAFGKSDEDGSAWLTAFVMKSFHAASRFISVDKKYIEGAGKWLKKNQLPSGCFANRGKLFRTTLQGDVNDDISLNAYITIAFLKTGWSEEVTENKSIEGAEMLDPMVQNAVECLRNSIPMVDSLYTKSLLAYLFTLAKDYDTREILLQELHDRAEKAGGETYWPANLDKVQKKSAWSEPNSKEVELASYVILAHVSLDTPTMEDISKASFIAKWTARQRNPRGGFASTQDTVVGYQGLSLYAKKTYAKHDGLEITLRTDKEGTLHRFNVAEKTRLLLQKKQLTRIPGNYTVQVTGKGCVFIQTSLKYNVYKAEARSAFDIKVNVTVVKVQDQAKPNLHYDISVRYTGPRNASNMVLVQVELPSGFNTNEESLTRMTKGLVKRTEKEGDIVNIYISELCRTYESFSFSADEEFTVQNQKPKMIKAIDYYDIGENAVTMYDVPNY